MTNFTNQNPTTRDLLSPLNFRFVLKRAPNVDYFIQKVNLPGLTVGPIEVPNPFGQIFQSSNKAIFDELEITFKVNENFDNWLEIWEWLVGLGHPEMLEQYGALQSEPLFSGKGLESDITILVLDPQRQAQWEIIFQGARPVYISGLLFEADRPDVKFLSATAKFCFTGMNKMRRVNEPAEFPQGTSVEI